MLYKNKFVKDMSEAWLGSSFCVDTLYKAKRVEELPKRARCETDVWG